jgi:hypothetical protein
MITIPISNAATAAIQLCPEQRYLAILVYTQLKGKTHQDKSPTPSSQHASAVTGGAIQHHSEPQRSGPHFYHLGQIGC